MSQIWVKAKAQGVRYREHASRKHGLQLDRYFSIRYRVGGKEKEEGLGWASKGWTITKASDTLAELKRNARTGEGEKTLSDKRKVADAAKLAMNIEKARIETENVTFNSMFKFFPAELWQVASNGTPQGLLVGHREGM